MADAAPNKTSPPSIEAQLLRDHQPDLQGMIRAYSLTRFMAIARLRDFTLKEHDAIDSYVYGSHQAMLLVASKDLKVTFKAHFNVRDLTIPSLKAEAAGEAAKLMRLTQDFFREYANLVAGGIKQQLQSCGIICGISLPIVTSGYDEMIFSDTLRKTRLYDFWKIRSATSEFTCTAHVDVFDSTRLATYSFKGVASTQDEGSLEFL